jgi:hypothetical protein
MYKQSYKEYQRNYYMNHRQKILNQMKRRTEAEKKHFLSIKTPIVKIVQNSDELIIEI